MPVKSLPPDVLISDVLDVLDEDGCVIIEHLATPSLINRVNSEIALALDKTPFAQGEFVGYRSKRGGRVLAKSLSSSELITNPLILDVMDGILGPHCQRFQLHITQLFSTYPGETAQILHQDDGLFEYMPDDYEYMVNVAWALTDFTEENGGTRVVPGSHKWPKSRLPADADTVHAVMPKGSALIWLGSLFHGGGDNRSSNQRTGIILSYNLGWLRQSENQYLAVPPEIAKGLAPEVQALIGYAPHEPNLGIYENQDARIVLQDHVPEFLPAMDVATDKQMQLLENATASSEHALQVG